MAYENVQRDDRDWPVGLPDNVKVALIHRCRRIMFEAGRPLQLYEIAQRLRWDELDPTCERDMPVFRKAQLVDWTYACVERALRAVGDPTWVLREKDVSRAYADAVHQCEDAINRLRAELNRNRRLSAPHMRNPALVDDWGLAHTGEAFECVTRLEKFSKSIGRLAAQLGKIDDMMAQEAREKALRQPDAEQRMFNALVSGSADAATTELLLAYGMAVSDGGNGWVRTSKGQNFIEARDPLLLGARG